MEVAIGKLKSYKAAGIDNIPTELIKACGEAGVSKIHRLVKKIWVNEKLPEEWKESILIPIHKKGPRTDCNNYRGISLLPVCYKIFNSPVESRNTPRKLSETTDADLDGIVLLLIKYFLYGKY